MASAVSTTIVATLPLLLLSACSQTPQRQQPMTEALITNITANGLRQFTYEVAMGRDVPGGGGLGGGPRSGPPGGGSGDRGGPAGRQGGDGRGAPGQGPGPGGRDTTRNLDERLAARLEQTGYCAHGWFVIRTEERAGLRTIFGECKAVLPQDPHS